MGLMSGVSSLFGGNNTEAGIFAAAGGLNPTTAAGMVGLGGDLYAQYKNYQLQKDMYQYQQELQDRIFAREDMSIQRRVADLKAAGLSPVLAAGQGAGTGGTVSVNAPQLGSVSDATLAAASLMRMEAEISATRAQEAYTRMQTRNAGELLPAQIAQIESGIKNADSQTYRTYQEAKKAKVEADNMTATGTSGTNSISQWYRDVFGASSKAVDVMRKEQTDKAKGKPVKPDLTPLNKELDKLKSRPMYDNQY